MKVYTDTYSDSKADIITDIKVKRSHGPGSLKLKVKVDPRIETICIK